MRKSLLVLSAALLASLSFPALADPGKVVIGLIEDMSNLYSDINGPAGVEAIKMAIAVPRTNRPLAATALVSFPNDAAPRMG
jgi:hypothetical protein